MKNPLATEVSEYLIHGDYSLAIRRTLDFCLDTSDSILISRAIKWSQQYRLPASEASQPDEEFLKQANVLLEDASAIKPSGNPLFNPLIEATQIAKTYPGGFSLKPIDISLMTGKVLGIVGENGNGKTTLLRCLAGQLTIDSGTIQYPLLKNPDAYAIKNHIAFIPQRIPRWYGKLKDNLHFSSSIAGIYGAENNLMVDFMLERLDLTRFANHSWSQISSGYRTRFELARILLQKPKLLILDEPLANLDINAQQTILTDLVFIASGKHNPMGIILSSQQLHEVEKVADQVIFIKQGEGIYNSKSITKDTGGDSVIEFETDTNREVLTRLFEGLDLGLKFNGGFYTANSSSLTPQQILSKLVQSQIPVTYFRDITHSTKRFF